MTVFDESLINDILKENFVNNNSNFKYKRTDKFFSLKTKDTTTEVKSFLIYLNKFNTELYISYVEIFYQPKLLQREWTIRCMNYSSFNKILTFLINKNEII